MHDDEKDIDLHIRNQYIFSFYGLEIRVNVMLTWML